jgi:pyrroline-5-carboxylate reductase
MRFTHIFLVVHLSVKAASGFAVGSLCNDNDREVIKAIFGAVGIAVEIKEILLNAVTGVSGSGPAYVYQFIEALADGGVRAGLPRQVAYQLAAQTVKGAAEMVLQTGQHPGQLKDNVTSPGGTTIAGVEALEKGNFRATTISAVLATTRRSMQLGGISEEEIKQVHNL